MAIRTKEELLSKLSVFTDGREDDETLEFVEDITDTLNNLEENSGIEWKEKYEENDREWRKKYKERFFSGEPEPEPEPEPESTVVTYDDLFSDIKF